MGNICTHSALWSLLFKHSYLFSYCYRSHLKKNNTKLDATHPTNLNCMISGGKITAAKKCENLYFISLEYLAIALEFSIRLKCVFAR